MYESYGDEITSKLVLKPFETIFILLPKIYEEYVRTNGLNEDQIISDFKHFLINNVTIHIIVAYPETPLNKYNENESFKSQLKDKYILYQDNLFSKYDIVNNRYFTINWLRNVIEKSPLKDIQLED